MGISVLKWVGLALALIVSAVSIGLGFWQEVPAQQVIFYGAATFALVVWAWRYYTNRWAEDAVVKAARRTDDGEAGEEPSAWNLFLIKNRAAIIGLLLLLAAFGIASITVEGFFSVLNIISLLVLVGLTVFSAVMGKFVIEHKSAFIGLTVLVGLFVIGALKVDGFVSGVNIKSMLLFAAFLGLACVGQTLVALLGGLDLSIPFVIGAANVGLLYIMGLGMPSWLAVIVILLAGAAIGWINGILSYRLQGQALIVTLGVGFAVSGLTQIV
ncbi:MAG: ABC transporter permease, partial [Kiloniellaceae bacterium]